MLILKMKKERFGNVKEMSQGYRDCKWKTRTHSIQGSQDRYEQKLQMVIITLPSSYTVRIIIIYTKYMERKRFLRS